MDFQTKPLWLNDYTSLMEVANHHLYLPSNMDNPTTLPDINDFNSGLRQFLFWKGQLMPSLKAGTVFLAFLGPTGLKPPNIINVTNALKDVIDLSSIVEFYQGANTNFFAISFSSTQQVTKILSHFKFFDDSVVLAVTHDHSPMHHFRLLWLPPLFEVNRVHHLLNRYTKSHRLRRESIGIAGGAFAPTNVVSGTLVLESGGDVAKLPHLIQLPSPHKGCALLTIDGRPPLCLKCRAIGHTRKKCTMIKCMSCTKVHFPSTSCGASSYSSVASRNITSSSEDDWLAGLAEEPLSGVVEPAPSVLPAPSTLPITDTTTSIPTTSMTCTTITSLTTSLSSDLLIQASITENLISPPFAHDTAVISSPPTTRSRAHKKQVLSTGSNPSRGLRSEMLIYTPHLSTPSFKNESSLIVSPPESSHKSFEDVEESMDSASSDDGPDLSDIEVDLGSVDSVLDPSSSRKRKLSGLLLVDSPSVDGDDLTDSPSSSNVPSPFSPAQVDLQESSPSLPDLEVPVLSEEDNRLASLFSLSPIDLLRLKDVCPGQCFSALVLKKLKILLSHSIPVIQVIHNKQFFNLTPSAISHRLKTLERHHSSTIQLTDLFYMTDLYDRMDGTSGTRLTPQLCSPNPFNTDP